jgi:heptose I phosphotransferase
MELEGEVFRAREGRSCQRLTLGGRRYFIKIHRGVGWREILKNLLSLRLPVLSSASERRAIARVSQLGVAAPVVAGFGLRGRNPARLQSFLITDELDGTVSLEEYCRSWPVRPPPFDVRRALIVEVARIARALHENGVNHRDFYLCHFLLDRRCVGDPEARGARGARAVRVPLWLIDLHRAQVRRRTPRRWAVKDLAGLLFSSFSIGLTRADVLRFARAYRGDAPLRAIIKAEGRLWRRVLRQAVELERRLHDRPPPALVKRLGCYNSAPRSTKAAMEK